MTHPALCEHSHYLNALTPEGCGTPGPDELVMRVSTVGSADLCPGRVHWRAHPDYQDEPGEQLVFGTLVHCYIQRMIEGDRLASRESAEADAFNVLVEEIGADTIHGLFGTWGRYLEWVGEAVNLAYAWKRWAREYLGWPIPEKRWVEQQLAAPIPDSQLWLAGTPDLILPAKRLGLDWKTSAKGWPPARAAGQNQHHAYRWLAAEALGVEVDEWWFVVGNRSTQTWTHFPVTPSAGGWYGFAERAQALAGMLAAGTVAYHPKSSSGQRAWWCSPMYCPAWNLCSARYLGDQADTVPRREDGGWPGRTGKASGPEEG